MTSSGNNGQKNGNDPQNGKGGFASRARGLFTFSNLMGIPSNLATMRKFMSAINWREAQEEVATDLERKVAIVGLANSGKSTLFNTLKGKYASPVSAQAGTTTTLVRGAFGPFSLIDTPGHLPDLQDEAMREASVVMYLLDAEQGVRPRDIEVVKRMRDAKKPFVVALNKSDLLVESADDAAIRAALRLHINDVIPLSALTGENIAEELIPGLIDASPEAALVIGRQLPEYRRSAANKIVRTATLVSLVAGMEPIPLIDIPILLSNQVRLLLRVAAVYGEPMSAQHIRELLVTVAGGLALRYLAEELAKAVPFGGDFVSGAIAAAGTWAIGQVAIEYFEHNKKLSGAQINEMFGRYYRRYREEHPASEGRRQMALPPASATSESTDDAEHTETEQVLP
ncbi:MAG TPA: GTP-binding protein [Ktedonobacterales bacterium]|nr:GTP-binding protein [Ktedonobacterales bacterium]